MPPLYFAWPILKCFHLPCVKQQVCDSYAIGWDSEEEFSDAEQWAYLHWKEKLNDGRQSSIEKFFGAAEYKPGLIAYLTHLYTDLTHFHFGWGLWKWESLAPI